MLAVKDLKRIAATLSTERFERQMGPFVLIQRPIDEATQHRAMQLGAQKTMAVKSASETDHVSLLLNLDECLVATLPPMSTGTELLVGRMPDCELVIDDPSVSKNHAKLVWHAEKSEATVEDLGSSNGTHVNGVALAAKRPLHDGDEISFGDAQFCFLKSSTLHSKLGSRA